VLNGISREELLFLRGMGELYLFIQQEVKYFSPTNLISIHKFLLLLVQIVDI
jgi:hypothetical protein